MKISPKYVPIVKWKKGEQTALRELSTEISNSIIPLIEITPDFNIEKLEQSFNYWSNKYYYFDISPELYENNPEIYLRILEQLNPNYVIPVLTHSNAFNLINYATELSNNGIALRITTDTLSTLNTDLFNITQVINTNNIDLILDFKYIANTRFNLLYSSFLNFISLIPNINEFRNIIVSASSFPETLANINRETINLINMFEWQFYREYIHSYAYENKLNIIYSDYCICNPINIEFEPYMKPSFNIRYTSTGQFLVLKGNLIKSGGLRAENVSRLCNTLVSSDYFTNEHYSWGDNYIYTHRVNNQARYGSPTTWRAICTNHHITHIVNLLS